MPSIQIRKLSENVYRRLTERAKQDKRSLQQEAAWLLETALTFPELFHSSRWETADRVRDHLSKRYGRTADSVPLIRKMRDER